MRHWSSLFRFDSFAPQAAEALCFCFGAAVGSFSGVLPPGDYAK
jgi:hypothetical protein